MESKPEQTETELQSPEIATLLALADVHELFRALVTRLGQRSDVQDVLADTDLLGGPGVEFFRDAVLANGDAVSWQLSASYDADGWTIETGIWRNHDDQCDNILELPTRRAVSAPEFANAVVEAAAQLTAQWSDDVPMFPDRGYGEHTP